MDDPKLGTPVSAVATPLEDMALIDCLRQGDEGTFAELIARYNPILARVARMYVASPSVAEEVVQETWLGVLNGIARFEPRASLKTWILRILVNRAKTSAVREGRAIPFSSAFEAADAAFEPAVDPDRFLAEDTANAPAGWWSTPPREWETPEKALLAGETRNRIHAAVAHLPANQREVLTLRDIEGLSSLEVCNVLGITEMNQRVLLHRARSKVRSALERYFAEE